MIVRNRLRSTWLLLLVAFAAGVAGVLVARLVVQPTAGAVPSTADAAVSRLLALQLTDLTGQPATLARWQGKPLLINFWATWCPPCREEMPVLGETARSHRGVQFVGIAYDDLARVAHYAASSPPPYPLLVASSDVGSLFAALGNAAQGLPFTLLVGADGRVRWIKLGPFRSGAEMTRMLAAAR